MNSKAPAHEYDFSKALTTNRISGLWRMLSGFRMQYAGATISLAIAASSKTATFLLLRYFIDTVLGQGNYGLGGNLNRTLIIIGLGFLGLATLEGSFSYFSGRLAAFTAESITRRLRNYLFDHIQRLEFTYHDKTPTGELIERCTSDVDALRRFFSEQAIGVGRIILLFVINFTAIMNLNVKLALISIIIVPIIILTSVWFFKRVTKVYEKYQEQEAILSTTLQENLAGVRVVKAFARQEYEINKFNTENWEKYIRGQKTNNHARLILASFGYRVQFSNPHRVLHCCNHGDQWTDHSGNLPGLCRAGWMVDLADEEPRTIDRTNLYRVGIVQPCNGDHKTKT